MLEQAFLGWIHAPLANMENIKTAKLMDLLFVIKYILISLLLLLASQASL